MNQQFLTRGLCALCFLIFPITGCGQGSSNPEVVTEKDELTQWVSENPAPEEVEIQAIEE